MPPLWAFWPLMLIGIFQTGDTIYDGPEQSSPELGEFPYMVEIINWTNDQIRVCGGAIIDQKHILTAAHCVYNALEKEIDIIAGVVDLFSDSRIEQQGVAKIFIHKKYKVNGTRCNRAQSSRYYQIRKWFRDIWKYFKNDVNNVEKRIVEHDIAVLKLNEALPFGDNIKAVNLPNNDFLPQCGIYEFAGWGQTKIDGPPSYRLYAIRLVALSPQSCEAESLKVSSNEFCAIDPFTRSCGLEGDSGAPLVLDSIVYGVFSLTLKDPCMPSVFTKVSAHLEFIRSALKK